MDRESTYVKGMEDSLRMWGRVCGSKGNCETCPIGAVRGTNVTCQEFAEKFPEKMLSILMEMDKHDLTFYEEYCTRFPECGLVVEDLAQLICRKAAFEGYFGCKKDGSACVACWNERYYGDITVSAEEYDEQFGGSGDNENQGLAFLEE